MQPNIDGLSFDEVFGIGLIPGIISVLVTRRVTRRSRRRSPDVPVDAHDKRGDRLTSPVR
jgi:hypothetical protein